MSCVLVELLLTLTVKSVAARRPQCVLATLIFKGNWQIVKLNRSILGTR
jgi:hypothetical protein